MSVRPFIKVHDSIEDHPKIVAISDAAFRALITGWGWCHRHNTDGRMSAQVWAKRASKKARVELIDVGLVHDHGSEVEFHNYLEQQQSASERESLSEKRRRAGQAGGKARAKQLASTEPSNGEAEKRREEKKEELPLFSSAEEPADPPRRADVEGLCAYFLTAIERNGVKAKITDRWRTEARLMLDRDQRDKNELRAVIDWCTQDPFWRSNVLSIPKLREQYDRLRLAMQSKAPVAPERRPEPAWMR